MRRLAIILAATLSVCALSQMNAQTKKDMASLAKLSSQRDAAKVAMAKHKGNAGYMHTFVQLNDQLANRTMTADWLSPHDKYSKALRLYRVSQSTDPGDQESKKWIDQIESIYRSMHRPIPK
jgi:hypothetical protein